MEEILGNDAPEEFMCILSCELMKEPVLLPTSGNVCDISTMRRILLNDEHDPFNRAPLKMSDLIPQVELKARIEKWI
jgi:ubiquitin conjugation factor E4 B